MNFDKVTFLVLLLVTVSAASALAQAPAIDYLGYAWETGGFPDSVAGDELTMVGVANAAATIFGVDLGSAELTFYLYGLTSTGSTDIGGGNTMVTYSGGFLDIYEDAAQNADYGMNPPSPTTPSTFLDGDLFFSGAFSNFTLFLTSGGGGSYEGTLNGLGGSILGGACTGCAYTWGGSFLDIAGALIPAGYDLQMDGVFEIEAAVSTQESTWDSVKSLYR